jgi:hypothetical protein
LSFPDLGLSGVLPPFIGPTPIDPAAQSPYRTTLVHIASKMCGSDPRKAILRGLIAYRQQLAAIGLQHGFQWLSGSFLEDIETLERRDPRDVDLVTFSHRPLAAQADPDFGTFLAANDPLFDSQQVKAAFKCDSYHVDMDIAPLGIVFHTRYWYSLFSHRRNGIWKGMLEIPLAVSADDADALAVIGP